MKTTITIEKATWKELNQLKLNLSHSTINETINYLLKEIKGELDPSEKEGDASNIEDWGEIKMTTIKEEAEAYLPKQTKNISELPQISIDFELRDGEGTDKDGKEFKYKFIEINGEEYRVPIIILGQIKDILEENPNMKSFKVKKTGEGKTGTRYTVIPLS